MSYTNTNPQQTPQTGHGGAFPPPNNNHYTTNSQYHHQSPTPQNPPSGFAFSPTQTFTHQQPLGGASMQPNSQASFGQFNQQFTMSNQHLSIEHAAGKVGAVNPSLVALFYEACKHYPHLDYLCTAAHFAPDPTPAGIDEKRDSLNKNLGHYISTDGYKYICKSADVDPTMGYQPNARKLSSTYAQAFGDGQKLKGLLQKYNKNIFYRDAEGNIMYDLRKLFDPSGGVTIEYTPINGGTTYTISWNNMQGQELRMVNNNPARTGNQVAVMLTNRAEILKHCIEKGISLMVRYSFLVSLSLFQIISHMNISRPSN